MKLIKRSAVLFKTLIILTGFCALMMCWSGKARAQYPSASFTSNVFTGCAPLSVDFTNLSAQATNYLWDFGNGNNSTLVDPTTVYLTSGFYTVTLIAINNLTGNRDTLVATNYIRVLNDPVADFSASPVTGCEGDNNIVFTNLSTNANNYIWDFGDGTFSTLINPVHNYASAGVYTVKLIARNAFGCSKIIIKNALITIIPNPPAAFTVNQQSSCDANDVFNFNCTTPGVVGWSWDFGDGTSSSAQNPSHVYGISGSFTVSLIVFNSNGCSDTLVNPAFINIGPSLVPTFTVNSQVGCIPFNSTFNCTVPNATSWLWDFGDGTTSSIENPAHTYAAAGSYAVTLTVTTSVGCNGSVTLPGFITVDPTPFPSFSVNDPDGCVPHSTLFTNNSTNAATYLWEFGNGDTSTASNPLYTYPDSGIYNITLTAYSVNGCQAVVTQSSAVTVEAITALYSATPRTGCAPLPVVFSGTATPAGVTWNWDFGDGAVGTGQNINHTYNTIGNYIVSLIVTSASGCTDTITRNNYIRVVPDSTPYSVPDTIIVCTPPGSVGFTDPTTGSNSWAWDFGDGNTSTIKNPTHIYTVPGIYTVTLTSAMAGGCSQTFNPYAIINVIPFDTLPIVKVVTSACSPYTVQLNNLTMNVASYLWTFGDGDTSTLQNPVHTYAQPGTYTIHLELTSVNGCLSALTTTVTFGYQNVITVSDTTNCLGDAVNFGLNPSGAFVSALWDFGDGNTSIQLQPVYTYADTGVYYVSVTVTDTAGCVFSFSYPNAIFVSNPISAFTINQPQSGCVPYTVQFINNSTNAASYYWSFGDGTNSSSAAPSHVYTAPGTYTVSLNANKRGCRRTHTKPGFITVYEALANFSFTPDSGCMPLNVSFTDLSVNAVSWLWDFGDGVTSVMQNPVHTYTSNPTGDILLAITDNHGCIDSVLMTNIAGIVPDIQVSDTYLCRSSVVNFSTSLTAVSYLWDFGDGATSNLQNPSHIYTQTGQFAVSLACVLSSGCTTTASYPLLITVDAPVSGFMSPTLSICAPSLVNFINQSTGATSWLWDFGDGTTGITENPSHIYNVPGTYTISLIAYSDSGCSDTLTLIDYISVPGTFTDFTLTAANYCQNAVVQFTDQSINADYWFWNFGDGFTDTVQSPTHIYADSGSYTVTLITTDSIGCTSFYSYPNPVVIHPVPVASALLAPVAGCLPHATTFTNLSTGNAVYTWNFGNGISAAAGDTVYTYTIAGVYYPYLIATSGFGCIDTFEYTPGISVSGLPVPEFNSSMITTCVPATVLFANNSSGLLNPSYQWDFGNGQTSNLENPQITYNSAGIFQVSMVVMNAGGCSDTIVHSVSINDSAIADATASGTGGCAPYSVNFVNNSLNTTSYLWNFGDGSTSTASAPTHIYTVPGNYQVTLIAYNTNGCSDTLVFANTIQVNQTPVADFNRSPVSGCSPLSVIFTNSSGQLSNPVYSWDFGNGQTGNQASSTIIYGNPGLYPVTLIVANSNGCSDTVIKNVTVNQSPLANGSVSSYNGCAPHNVNFTNNSSNATGYLWDFGDGNTSAQVSPSHVYTTPGDYTVILIATGQSGCIDTMVFSSVIHINETPSAAITTVSSSGCTPVSVNFTSQSTGLINPVYSWNFGNGQTSTNPQTTINYTSGGLFTATLVVTNQGGCSDSASTTVTIYDSPVAVAATNDTLGCAPFQVSLLNTSLNGATYFWDFGDGATSTQMDPVHTYINAGDYIINLIVTGAGGCADTLLLSQLIHVKATPSAGFTSSTLAGCTPLTVNFNNNSTGLVGPAYHWDFGNGIQSTNINTDFTFLQGGVFNVSLVVINSEGCSDTAAVAITANTSPVAQAGAIDSSGCENTTVLFNSTSLFSTGVLWNFGDGTTSASANIQHTYIAAGTFYPYLIAYNASGCTDTMFFSSPVQVYPNPVAAFSVNQSSNCSGDPFQFFNQSIPASGLIYQWNIAGASYSTASPSVSIIAPGFSDASLVVINQFGCSDTMIQTNFLQVFDTIPPSVSPILSVSVLNNSSVEIMWENNSALDLAAYILYRYNTVTNTFQEVYRDTTPNNSSMNITSSYIDVGLNTLSTVYTYKLQTIDRCAYILPLSALTAHTTINITAAPLNTSILVSWTRYLGCPVASYQVNRVNLITGIASMIATVPPSALTYLDTGFYCPEEYSYRITATSLCNTQYVSLSDTSVAVPANILESQKVEVVRSTVINDRQVLTEWMAPAVAPERVVQFNVLKSTDNIDFTEIASLPPSTFSYIDYDVDVHNQEYYYRIEIINDCSISGIPGNNSSSILLRSNWEDEKTKLWWTPYSDWGTGVDYYVIEKENFSGQWLPVKTVGGNELNTILDE